MDWGGGAGSLFSSLYLYGNAQDVITASELEELIANVFTTSLGSLIVILYLRNLLLLLRVSFLLNVESGDEKRQGVVMVMV